MPTAMTEKTIIATTTSIDADAVLAAEVAHAAQDCTHSGPFSR